MTTPTRSQAVEAAVNLKLLIECYWEIAHAEGKEGRSHDTPDGAAQECLHQINNAIAALARPLEVAAPVTAAEVEAACNFFPVFEVALGDPVRRALENFAASRVPVASVAVTTTAKDCADCRRGLACHEHDSPTTPPGGAGGDVGDQQ